MTRFLGDSPLRVLVRLVLLSLLVGWVLRWLDLSPAEIGPWAMERAGAVIDLGVRAVDRFGDTVLLGAIVVVPLFILSRLSAARRRD